ncbi:MAG TPA: hypothetical protein VFX35_07805 [Solirubrobacterales bacterium]|nr:hypothetical protein [Solirubrobacterales bacterium]
MAYGIDAGVQPVEAPEGHPVLHRLLAKSEIQELRSTDHSMLSPHQLCDPSVIRLLCLASLS